jgi:Domain of unknown function (DUF4265)
LPVSLLELNLKSFAAAHTSAIPPETAHHKYQSWLPIYAVAILESVPFYLKNVSRGDTVAAVEDDFLRFSQVIARGCHNTYRLLMADVPDSEIRCAIADLEKLGLAVERSEIKILLAVDVPPSISQQEIYDYLVEHQELGRWQVQDGFLSSINTNKT